MRLLAPLLALLGVAVPMSAHPHLFLDSVVTLQTDRTGLTGLWLEWTFDPFFSAAVILENDRNRDNVFSKAETEQVWQNAFSNLRNYGFFLWLIRAGKETRPDRVEGFTARVQDDRLVYRFFVPYRMDVRAEAVEKLSILVHDETFYSDVRYDPDTPVRLQPGAAYVHRVRVTRDAGRTVRYSTADGSVSTNLGTKDSRYTGAFQPPTLEVELSRAR